MLCAGFRDFGDDSTTTQRGVKSYQAEHLRWAETFDHKLHQKFRWLFCKVIFSAFLSKVKPCCAQLRCHVSNGPAKFLTLLSTIARVDPDVRALLAYLPHMHAVPSNRAVYSRAPPKWRSPCARRLTCSAWQSSHSVSVGASADYLNCFIHASFIWGAELCEGA